MRNRTHARDERLAVGGMHGLTATDMTAPFFLSGLAARLRRRPHLLALAAIVALAVGVRLLWIDYANPDPTDGRFDDTVFYDISARSIAAWEGYQGFAFQETAQWPPGYSTILAVVYKLFGHNIYAAKMLNVAAGGVACIAVYALAAAVFGRWVGLVAAFVFALFPSSIYFSTLLLTESIFTALLVLLALATLVVVLRQDRHPLWALLLGVFFGAAALIRAESAVLLLAAFLVWRIASPSWRRFALTAGMFAVGAVAAVTPWTVRNWITMNAFIPLSTGAGHTLLAGHQHDPYDPRNMFPEADLRLKYADLPFPERETRVEDEAMERALRYMVDHPVYEVQLLFEKLFNMYKDDSDALIWIRGSWLHASKVEWLEGSGVKSLDEVGEPVITIPPRDEEKWSALADAYYYVVLELALVGAPFWFSVKDRRKLLLVLFVVAYTGAHLLFIPSSRYHQPLLPVFSIWAAVTVVFGLSRLAARTGFGGRR